MKLKKNERKILVWLAAASAAWYTLGVIASALGLLMFLAASCRAGNVAPPQQHQLPTEHALPSADPTGGFLIWVDALAAHDWVGVAALAVILGFAGYVLRLRQQGSLARETTAITSAVRAARAEWQGSRNADPPK